MGHSIDNYFLCAFVFFPLVTIIAALLNMAIAAAFSWSELIIDFIGGVIIGSCFYVGTAKNAGAAAHFFLVFSQGVPGILYCAKVQALGTREALFLTGSMWMIAATFLSSVLDRGAVGIGKEMSVGGGFFSILPWACKVPFSLVTTAVGMLLFVVGIFRSFGKNGRIGFLAGVPYVEWSTPGTASATTIGTTVQIWTGEFKELIKHELFHSRQCIYLHDWMIPLWVVGGIWGLVGSAIDGNTSFGCFKAAKHDRDLGNPLECAPYRISGYSNCP